MAKTKTPAQAAKPTASATPAASSKPGMIAKIKDFGKDVGSKVAAAGTKAASHVSHNRAAYIAGGAGVAGLTSLILDSGVIKYRVRCIRARRCYQENTCRCVRR